MAIESLPRKVLKKLVTIPNPDGTFRRYATYEEGAWDNEGAGAWVGAPSVRDEELTLEQYGELQSETMRSGEAAAVKLRDDALALLASRDERIKSLELSLEEANARIAHARDAARALHDNLS